MNIEFSFNRIALLYGIGSLMGAVTVTADWFVREMMGGGLALLSFQPGIDNYYMPMVWGGVWALLYIFPLNSLSWVWRGIIFGFAPALTHLSLKSGGVNQAIDFLSPDRFLRHDTLIVIIVYIIFWGLSTSYLSRKT